MGIRAEWLGERGVRTLLLVALVGAGLVPVLSRKASWLGSWKMALDWGTSSITLLGPVAAGIACTVYVRMRRSQLPELLSQAARPWLGWVAPAVTVWLLAVVAVLLICTFTTTAASAAGARAFPELYWVVLPALVVLAAEVSVGALIGSVLGRYWATPWAAVATFTLFILSSIEVIPGVFRTGGVTGPLAGATFHARVLAMQAVAALGIAAGAMALSHRDLFGLSAFLTRVATAVALVGAVVALLQLEDNDEPYIVLDRVEYDCREGRPTVCMLTETTRPLDDLAAKMAKLAPHLERAGVRLPDQFQQPVPGGFDLDHGSVRLTGDDDLADHVGYDAAARSLARPADCPAYSSDSLDALPEVVFAIDRILVDWILVQDSQEQAPSDGPLAGWWARPPKQQYAWVRSTYDALRDCRLLDLRLPRPGPAARR